MLPLSYWSLVSSFRLPDNFSIPSWSSRSSLRLSGNFCYLFISPSCLLLVFHTIFQSFIGLLGPLLGFQVVLPSSYRSSASTFSILNNVTILSLIFYTISSNFWSSKSSFRQFFKFDLVFQVLYSLSDRQVISPSSYWSSVSFLGAILFLRGRLLPHFLK